MASADIDADECPDYVYEEVVQPLQGVQLYKLRN